MPPEVNTDEAAMMALFGVTEDDAAPTQDPAPNPSTTEPETSPAPAGEDTSPGSTDNGTPETTPTDPAPTQTQEKDTTPNPEDKFTNKQNRAFAEMRVQNKELSDLIMSLASATGQTPKNITEAQEILKGGLTKVVSKNRNIPEDVLREMEEDKQALVTLRQNEARQKALNGFQAVKDAFGLSKDQINGFADKLIEHQLNPFEQELDLVKEYKNLYFDDLIKQAREAGIQEERARALKAKQNSTTPSTQTGLPEGTGNQGDPIKSVSELSKLLDSLK